MKFGAPECSNCDGRCLNDFRRSKLRWRRPIDWSGGGASRKSARGKEGAQSMRKHKKMKEAEDSSYTLFTRRESSTNKKKEPENPIKVKKDEKNY